MATSLASRMESNPCRRRERTMTFDSAWRNTALPYDLGMYSFIETKLFSRLAADVLTDEEYSGLQKALIKDPEAGDLIPGSGGPQITLGCSRSP